MKVIFFSFMLVQLILSGCTDIQEESYFRANPPVGVQLFSLTNENTEGYSGDYLLTFRSENRYNSRFGGFLVFIDTDENFTNEIENADYKLCQSNSNIDTTETQTANYNQGIDSEITVLFSDNEATTLPSFLIEGKTYNPISRFNKTNDLAPGNWLSLRSFLYDINPPDILPDSLSDPGNSIKIP